MELSGTLQQFPLRELLYLMQDTMMCGDLELQGRYGIATVSSRDGLIRHAAYNHKVGLEAMWLIFEEPHDAAFVIRSKRELNQESLIGDAKLLSDEGEERAQRWKSLRGLFPNDAVVPMVIAGSVPSKTIEPYDRIVFQSIDGVSSLADLAKKLVMEGIDVARSIARLADAGIVHVPVQIPTITIHHRTPTGSLVSTSALPKGGLLKRIAALHAR